MSNIEKHRGSRLSKSQKVDRLTNLTVFTGGVSVLFMVCLILSFVGIVGSGAVFVSGLIAAGAGTYTVKTYKKFS